ncbi:MAG TPA: RluA family pseudouridine synthase [Clostridia bacterium]|nr:RluA family pseudouridine synthase [Clostridia bacterium]
MWGEEAESNEAFSCTAQGGERLDVFAAQNTEASRSLVQKLIADGLVLVNGKHQRVNARLKAGDRVEISFPPPRVTELKAEDIPIDIVYEDADIAVINKEKGMVVHPAPGNESGTLVNALMFRLKDLSGIGGELRPGIVHRIDKLTSGLIVVAKNDMAHRALSEQIKLHTARRFYLALVEGNIKEDAGTVNEPVGRHKTDRKRMAVVRDGREAKTHWRVLERYGAFTLLALALETGRTHQIRVHMAYIKHPVAGDTVYGPEKPKLKLDGQALHAAKLTLEHPSAKETLSFYAPVPQWFRDALKRAGRLNEEGLDEMPQNAFKELT